MRGQVALCRASGFRVRIGTTNVLSVAFSVAWKAETAGMSVELMLLESEIHAGVLVCFLSAKP